MYWRSLPPTSACAAGDGLDLHSEQEVGPMMEAHMLCGLTVS